MRFHAVAADAVSVKFVDPAASRTSASAARSPHPPRWTSWPASSPPRARGCSPTAGRSRLPSPSWTGPARSSPGGGPSSATFASCDLSRSVAAKPDPLRFEKALLLDWLRAEIEPRRPS
jgi:hypothetical protein